MSCILYNIQCRHTENIITVTDVDHALSVVSTHIPY